MATYAFGDVQGCYQPLLALLEKIQFNPSADTLWFTGDLVNRGPQSLEVLRLVKNLGEKHRIVLGNHDLHLIARFYNVHDGYGEDTVQSVLEAPDADELITWLRHQPLLVQDTSLGYMMVHAGLAPSWDVEQAKTLAHEVEIVLQDESTAKVFLKHMYGNQPSEWRDTLAGWDRLRCITNYLTRARFCDERGRLELTTKGTLDSSQLFPWFRVPNRKTASTNIIFGHWAALAGETDTPHVHALDTGCVWGFCLTAMRLEDGVRVSVGCGKP